MPEQAATTLQTSSPSTPPALGEVHGLLYRAGGSNLIESIELVLDAKSLTVVMGPNGAGKSLLLRLMHGLLEPTAGEIRWGGRRLDDRVRARQAMVFQRPVLLRRSVAANLRFVLARQGKPSKAVIESLLAEVGLEHLIDQPARRLSGGEQQRLALARALALQPEVLFMDEPTASLDPAATASIEAIVRRAHERGVKIVFVTHDLGQARRLADDVVFLNKGRLVEHTSAERFFDQPESRQARQYLAGQLVLA
ncbi:MAG: ATP-binding cassette domain-containing protein [Wenzhouxiangellaceae bacterium]|nr:ATP-binding cassette domain-containing protein [Wenzhouxiangellaceae bacterium]